MKSVLISIQPKWYDLIERKGKTVVFRKSAPKKIPFKAYIYLSHSGNKYIKKFKTGKGTYFFVKVDWHITGKVVGEFVCDKVEKINPRKGFVFNDYYIDNDTLSKACLTRKQLVEFGDWKPIYCWHISDLKIYDKPRELSEFHTICKKNKRSSCADCLYLAGECCSYLCDDSVSLR